MSAPVDPTMVLSKKNVAKAVEDKSGKVYRVYCDGIFDLFHVGHMKMLEQAKKSLGDAAKVHLLVGVCSDALTHKYKGKTVLSDGIRYESARHCKWVDEVIEDAPWVLDTTFLAKHRIDFVAHDALPYATTGIDGDVYAPVKIEGKFLETQRTDGISTSDIIVTIVKNYDTYIKRNLNRGYTKEDLNVGLTWEYRSQAHEKEGKFKASLKQTRALFMDLTENGKHFIRVFDPRAHADVKLRDLPQKVQTRTAGLWGTYERFVKASMRTWLYLFSWLNPVSYLTPSHRRSVYIMSSLMTMYAIRRVFLRLRG